MFLFTLVDLSFAQTTKGSFMIGFHNYSPGPVNSDGLGINLFPQTNGLGISFGTGKQKVNGEVSDEKEKTTLLGLSFNTHYFVADNFALGLVGSFSSSSLVYKEEGEEDDKTSATLFLVGPEVRYYFDTGEKAKFWLKGGAAIGSVSSKYDGSTNDTNSLSQYGGGAGISLFPVSGVSIDFGLGYNVLNITDKSDFGEYKYINGSFVFDIGFGFFF
jgi:hypothetical protein